MDETGDYNSTSQPEMDPNATRHFPPQGGQPQASDPNKGQTTPLTSPVPEPSRSRSNRCLPLAGIALLVGFMIMSGRVAAFHHAGSAAATLDSAAGQQFNGNQPQSDHSPLQLAPDALGRSNTSNSQGSWVDKALFGSFGAMWHNDADAGHENPGRFLPFALIGLGVFFLVKRSRRQYQPRM